MGFTSDVSDVDPTEIDLDTTDMDGLAREVEDAAETAAPLHMTGADGTAVDYTADIRPRGEVPETAIEIGLDPDKVPADGVDLAELEDLALARRVLWVGRRDGRAAVYTPARWRSPGPWVQATG